MGLRHLKPPASGQITHWDRVSPIGIRVSQGGSKTFIVLLGSGNRKTIGRYGVLSLQQARDAAKRILAERTLGIAIPSEITFPSARDRFLEARGETLKPRSLYEIKRTLNLYFHWQKTLDKITHNDIANVIEGIKKPSERLHAIKDIKTFFSWCVPRYIAHSPCEGLKKPKQKDRERVLTESELAAVWKSAGTYGYPFGIIVQLLLLTGQRRSEIGALRRTWIDPDEKTITLPSEITKNGREHIVPFGAMTTDILSGIPDTGDLLFPARGQADKPFCGYSGSKVSIDEVIQGDDEKSPVAPWTLHDLRRTASTMWAEIGVPEHINDKLLNHIVGSKISRVAAIYNRYEYLAEKREAVQLWEERLAVLVA
jgi:integrase